MSKATWSSEISGSLEVLPSDSEVQDVSEHGGARENDEVRRSRCRGMLDDQSEDDLPEVYNVSDVHAIRRTG